jgi:hypothetical protein
VNFALIGTNDMATSGSSGGIGMLLRGERADLRERTPGSLAPCGGQRTRRRNIRVRELTDSRPDH